MLVMGDGPELFVNSGTNDAPMWKQFCDGLLVGVGATRDLVYALDDHGRLACYRGMDGAKMEEVRIAAKGPHGLANDPTGFCAVVCKGEVVLADTKGFELRLPAPKAAVAAFGPSRAVGIGSTDGTFQAVDGNTGQPWGSCNVGGRIEGVAWRSQGQWAVAAGEKVHLVSGDGTAPVMALDAGGPVGPVAISGDGALLAVVVGQQVVVFELHGNKRIGQITFTRTISGLGFGPNQWLGIGLDDNESNRVDLMTGQMCRSEAHPGRTANRWGLKVEVDHLKVRQAVTMVRAGGQAIATFIDPEEDEGGGGMSCLTMFLIFVLLTMICMGCLGLAGGGYFFLYMPK